MKGQRVALVTAAAGAGIGSATARTLARDGMEVVITDIHERRCREFAEVLSAEFDRPFCALPLDVTDFDAVGEVVHQACERYGRIDILVNNAGWNALEPIAEMTLETWHRCLDVDLNGTFYAMRHVLPHMIRQGFGAIVNVSSAAGWTAIPDHGAYAAAKAGVMALTRVAAAEVGPAGVRVNAVAPGFIYNDFLRKIYPKEFFDNYSERTLTRTIGESVDVAELVAFLVSDKAKYITGEVYGISGGEYARA